MSDTGTLERPADEIELRDADGELLPAFVERVSERLAAGDRDGLFELVGDLHEADLGAIIEALDSEERPRLVAALGRDFDYAALTEVDDTVREEILEEIPNERIAEGVADLDSDDAVAILEDLEPEDRDEILARIPDVDRATLTRALDYPDESAGRRMQADLISVPPFWTVGRTIDHCRETADLPERFYEIFVVGPTHELLGTVPLDRLLRTKRPVVISEIAEEVEHPVHAGDEAAEVARLFQLYNLVSAPVLDEAERLVGVITVDDVVDVIGEAADAEIKALGGVKSDEELSDRVFAITRSRFGWLFVNLLTAILASWVIGLFEGSLEKMVALAVLMPIVASMGGNAGTQTMTVAVRALATRDLGRANAWRIVRREVAVGFLNGLAFAVIMGAVAAVWFQVPSLFLVMGLAMVCVLVAGALGGILIPLALDRAGVDPAVASGPFVTTVTDVVGFFAFLGIATLWFGFR
jgi:magnesium transporter